MRHLDSTLNGQTVLLDNAAALTSLRAWAEAGEGNDAHNAFHFILAEVPTIAPLFRIIQEQRIHYADNKERRMLKIAAELMVPLHADGSLQIILQMLARPTPTEEDPSKWLSIQTQPDGVPSILMIYIQRKRVEGGTCGRQVEYGQRLLYCGAKFGIRGALHFHSDHYTAVVGRGNRYYYCNDSTVKEITRSEAFGAYGDARTVQMLMYSRIVQ